MRSSKLGLVAWAVLGAAVVALGCGGQQAAAPAAAPSAASAAPAPSMAPAAPAPSTSVAVAPSAAPSAAPAPMPKGTGETGDADEHRRSHHGGVGMLIGMSVRDLDLSADQKTAVEKIRADMQPKMAPLRAAARDLNTLLADGVAAGSVDKAKADKAIDKLMAQTKTMQAASLDALGKLHAVLTPPQRAALVDKVGENWEKWKASHGQDEKDEKEHKSGHLLALVRDLGLSEDEAKKIKAAFQAKMKTAPQEHEHKEVQEHLQKFGAAFKADKFDPKTVSSEKADGHMAKWGATRRAAFLEAAAPILTPDQRTKLADKIRSEAPPAEK